MSDDEKVTLRAAAHPDGTEVEIVVPRWLHDKALQGEGTIVRGGELEVCDGNRVSETDPELGQRLASQPA